MNKFERQLQQELAFSTELSPAPDLQSVSQQIGQRVRKRQRRLRVRQWAVRGAVLILIGFLAVRQWLPAPYAPEPEAVSLHQGHHSVNLRLATPLLQQDLPFTLTVAEAEAAAGFPIMLPQRLPDGMAFVGGGWHADEHAAEVAFLAADNALWILSRRAVANSDGLLTTQLGPRTVAGLTVDVVRLGELRALSFLYTYEDGYIATLEWQVDAYQMKMTVYLDEPISVEELAATVEQMEIRLGD